MSTSNNSTSNTSSKNDSNKSNTTNNSNNSNNSNISNNNSNKNYTTEEESNNSADVNPLPDVFTGYLPSPIPSAVIPARIPYPPNSSSSYINSFSECYVKAFRGAWSQAFIQGFNSFKGAPMYSPSIGQNSNDDTTTTQKEDEDEEAEENEEDTEIKQIAVQDGGAEPYPEDTRDPHEEEGPEPYLEDFL